MSVPGNDRRILAAVIFTLINIPTVMAAPYCASNATDYDGDGWAWENEISCVVTGTSAAEIYGDGSVVGSTSQKSAVTSTSELQFPVCESNSSDPDGNGYGWENYQTCISGSSAPASTPDSGSGIIVQYRGEPACENLNADPDGDGYGWENHRTCITSIPVDSDSNTNTATFNPPDNDTGTNTGGGGTVITTPAPNPQSGGGYQPSDITDLIVITGQSNTLGGNTAVDLSLDSPHERVFAFTSNGWQKASLYQSWDRGSHPGSGEGVGSRVHNNFALHFGKRLADLAPERVVGFVLISEPGEGIEHWHPNNSGYQRVLSKTYEAINQLPHKGSINGLLWHQGETDWIANGTSDPDAPRPAPDNYYPARLNQLIGNFRAEPWFSGVDPFICGETIAADLNVHLMALNNDGDDHTGCVAGSGLPDQGDRAHLTAEGLRTIGARYAEKYLQMNP